MGSLFFLQWILPTQEWNRGLLNNLEILELELKEEIHRGFLLTDNCRQLESEFKILIYEVDFK